MREGNIIKLLTEYAAMAVSECPSCTYHIALPSSMAEGEVMQCPDCGESLKLLSLNPPIFELVKDD